ncbi:MAG: hypothetical protein MN733_35370 [Nitrososphaera sp.]|nr:hypothetical protein [Nitrososphaera sp.]
MDEEQIKRDLIGLGSQEAASLYYIKCHKRGTENLSVESRSTGSLLPPMSEGQIKARIPQALRYLRLHDAVGAPKESFDFDLPLEYCRAFEELVQLLGDPPDWRLWPPLVEFSEPPQLTEETTEEPPQETETPTPPPFVTAELDEVRNQLLEEQRHHETERAVLQYQVRRAGCRSFGVAAVAIVLFVLIGLVAFFIGQSNEAKAVADFPTATQAPVDILPPQPTAASTSRATPTSSVEPTLTTTALTPAPPVVPLPIDSDQSTSIPESSPTNTPRPTTTPSPTPDLLNMGEGDVIEDGRVALKLVDEVELYGCVSDWPGGGCYDYAIIYPFEFTNNSGSTMILRFDNSIITLTDNINREYECHFHHDLGFGDVVDEVNTDLAHGEVLPFQVICGSRVRFDVQVTSVALTMQGPSSLPTTVWPVEIAG